MNTITIPSFRANDLVSKWGQIEADYFILMWITRMNHNWQWGNGWFSFARPKDSKSAYTIEEDAKRAHDSLYDFLVKVIEYNIKNK